MYGQTLPEQYAVTTITGQTDHKIKFKSHLQPIMQVLNTENLTMFRALAGREWSPDFARFSGSVFCPSRKMKHRDR
jgi:hypothetical protein